MGRMSFPLSPRRRSERIRRRVLVAEALESRRLLSAATLGSHTLAAPTVSVPALVGLFNPSPSANLGSPGSSASITPLIQVVFVVSPAGGAAAAGNGSAQGILIVEASSSVAGAPAGNPSSLLPTGAGSSSGSTAVENVDTATPITPLTSAILAGPLAGNRVPVAVIVPSQPLVVNLGPSTISVTTQSILATATLEEQPLAPPVLGQGFESPVGQGLELPRDGSLLGRSTGANEEQPPATDIIEPNEPAPENPAPASPDRPAEPPPVEALPPRALPLPDATLQAEPFAPGDPSRAPTFTSLSPRQDDRTEVEPATWSVAAMVGTFAVASGGYRLVLGRSNRFNQRWLPREGSADPARGRRSGIA